MTTAIPPAYLWLLKEQPLPRMVSEALKLFGTVETPGRADNPIIMGWATEIGVTRIYSGDEVPWCGLFMGVVAKRAGKVLPPTPLWARDWLNFGRRLRAGEVAALGDVLIFGRNGGGHVGLYVGEDLNAYHVLGGNQSDRVCITRIAKGRMLGVRRPIYNVQPATVQPHRLAASGGLSTNEA